MTTKQMNELIARAAELSTMRLDELRAIVPTLGRKCVTECETIRSVKFQERIGADTKEIRSDHIKSILESEFGYLAKDEE